MNAVAEIDDIKCQIKKLASKIELVEDRPSDDEKVNLAAWRSEKLALTQQLTEYVKLLPATVSPSSVGTSAPLSPDTRRGRANTLETSDVKIVENARRELLSGSERVKDDDKVSSNNIILRDGSHISGKLTVVEKEVRARRTSAHYITEMLPAESTNLPQLSAYLPSILTSAIFCGHLVTDLDSIAGSIGAAELYGGIPARASETNSETNFALNYWGLPKPLPIEELIVSQPTAGICLVDHQQLSQVNPCIKENSDRIVGVIDHHALQNSTIVTEKPIYMDIRPWGSMSTIISHSFMVHQRRPRKCVAGMLLCAILSDTLNLLGPTTTDYDRMMVAILCEICNVTDIDALASMQFKAKSQQLESLTARQLCTGDLKEFSFNTTYFKGTLGFAVIETIDDGVILARREELLKELKVVKAELKLELLYLAVVNITPPMHSTLLLLSNHERSLAEMSFPSIGPSNPMVVNGGDTVFDLGTRVSRKKDFVPSITRSINKENWAPPEVAIVY
jgi:inorganic pyrophosphatase/exopolyphosphatase